MIKYLHIMNNNLDYSKNFIDFVKRNFDSQEHVFLFFKENDMTQSPSYNNVIYRPLPEKYNGRDRNFRVLLNLFQEAEYLLWNSLLFERKLIAYIAFFTDLATKSTWLSWGADIYYWKLVSSPRFITQFKIKLLNKGYELFVRQLNSILCLEAEEAYVRKEFGFRKKIFNQCYFPVNYDAEMLDKCMDNKKHTDSQTLKIMVGNSAAATLNHQRILNLLQKYTPDIEVYMPLTYGDRAYGEEVEAYGKALFGERCICLKEQMAIQAYIEFLNEMDIVIFDTEIQIGLSNLTILFYLNKKVYLSEKSIMYNYFIDKEIKIGRVEGIEHENFEQFKENTALGASRDWARHRLDPAENIANWSALFNGLRS